MPVYFGSYRTFRSKRTSNHQNIIYFYAYNIPRGRDRQRNLVKKKNKIKTCTNRNHQGWTLTS